MARILVIVLAWLPCMGLTQTVYKSTDERGNVVYSSNPAEGTTKAEAVEIVPGPTRTEQDAARAREKKLANAAKRVDENIDQRRDEKKQQQDVVEQAEEQVREAEAALAQAREKTRHDYRDMRTRRRLKKSYYDRVREHEVQLREAQEHQRKVESVQR